jgi:alkylation response protein AidB-like acyl-CoA dehydrogenase
LPALASGDVIGTVALAGAPETRAAETGGGWTITGQKTHVSDAVASDAVVVTATAADGELGAFVVARDAPGLEIAATPTVDGTRKFAAVVDGVGAASRALEMAVEYAKERRQFDRPIGSFQAVQHLCADTLRAVGLARAGAYYACWAADAADPAERHRAATIAQAFAADELYAVGASLIQVHGGIGFTWEHDAHLFYKRLLTLKERAGGSPGQLEELASLVLDSG